MNRSTFRRLRNSSVRPLVPLIALFLAGGSWRSAQRTGRRLGSLAYRLARGDRRRALAHVEIAFPDRDETFRQSVVRQMFSHLGMSLAEFLYLSRQPPTAGAEHLDIEGWEHVAKASANNQGAVIATGHCGNWELFGPAFLSQATPLAAIARSFEESWVNDRVTELRRRLGTEMIRRGEPDAARRLLALFRSGGNLLVLIDHDIDAESVWVPFFGIPAHTAVGPARMSIRHSLAVIPAFCQRLDDGRHTVRFHPALDTQENEEALTATMTSAVEAHIRRAPAQWTWMHRRWRRRPPSEAAETAQR
jgi:KDO2-lipid IV(A) lauroyltransferase